MGGVCTPKIILKSKLKLRFFILAKYKKRSGILKITLHQLITETLKLLNKVRFTILILRSKSKLAYYILLVNEHTLVKIGKLLHMTRFY